MNTPNNKRKRDSQEKIEKVFVEVLQSKNLNEISVTDICKKTKLNRSTFYANYLDVYDLADKLKVKLEKEVEKIYTDERENNYNSNDFLKLFKNVEENQLFYKTFFKLGYDNNYDATSFDTDLARLHFGNEFIDYHIEFFKAGLNAILKKWLANGCKETPEEINSILQSEYKKRNFG